MMNKAIFFFTILFPLIFILFGCAPTSTSVLTLNHNFKSVEQATRQIVSSLNMKEVITVDSMAVYVRENAYAFKPNVQAQSDSITKLTLLTGAPSQEVCDNLGKTFSSFYLQSLDSNYIKQNPSSFFRLEPKSSAEMYRRNWISPALGIHYVGKENPFIQKADYTFGKISLGIFDVLGLSLVVGGPFIGKTTKDKIGTSLTGVLMMLGWRILIPAMQGSRDLEEYNNIVNTRYSLPIEIKRE